MNIVYSVPSLGSSYGGPVRSIGRLAESIVKRDNIKISIISNSSSENKLSDIPDKLVNKKIDIYLKKRTRKNISFDLADIKGNNSEDQIILHDNGIWTYFNYLIVSSAISEKIPFLISTRGMLDEWSLTQKALKKNIAWFIYQKSILNRADVIHATSEQEFLSIRKAGIKTPVAIVPNGIEIPIDKNNKQVYKPKRLLYLGRIHPKKGLDNLIAAWASNRPKGWKLDIVGPGDSNYKKKLIKKTQELNLGNSVNFYPQANDLEKEDFFKSSSGLILPSFSENFGNVVLEALVNSLLVITTNKTPWSQIEKYNCGIVIEPSVNGIAKSFALLGKMSHEDIDLMGQNGLFFANEIFNIDRISEDMLMVYDWILNRSSKPNFVIEE